MENELRKETDFIRYLHKLRDILPKVTVIITAYDTPAGPPYDEYVSREFMRSLGLRTDLRRFYRHAYIAIIKNGQALVDSVSQAAEQAIEVKGNDFHVVSAAWGAMFYGDNPVEPAIKINGKDYAICSRGLNFVVVDDKGKLIDSCCFDTFYADFHCTRNFVNIIRLQEYIDNHPHIKVVCFNQPITPRSNLSECEKFILDPKNASSLQGLIDSIDNWVNSPKYALTEFYKTAETLKEVFTVPESYIDIEGVRRFKDRIGKNLNILGGIRVTVNQPENPKRAIFIIGGCVEFGVGAADKHTIASYLQARMNKDAANEEFVVFNYGYYLANGQNDGVRTTDGLSDQIAILESLSVKPGDIVLFTMNYVKNFDFDFIDIKYAATRPHNYGEVFFDAAGHLTPNGHRLVADRIFDYLAEHKFYPISELNANLTPSGASEAKISGGGVQFFRVGGALPLSTRAA